MAQNTSVGVLSNIFAAPSAAFVAIKARPNPWLPLLILIGGTCAVQFAYTQSVDLAWMLDRQFEAANMPEDQRAEAVDSAMRMPPLAYGFIVAIPAAIFILVVYAIIALYYTGVSFATHDGIKYGQWLALIAWCSLPSVLGVMASLVNLAVTDARFLPPEQLNPLSFGSLLALDPQGATTVQSLLMQLDVTVLWSTVLQILGYQAFTQRSLVKATIVVLGPLALIVAIGSLAALT